MAWYWWILIILGIIILIGMFSGEYDSYEEEEHDWMYRLQALMIINDLKWRYPEKWAQMASDIVGKPVNPPTPEQIAEYKAKYPEKFK